MTEASTTERGRPSVIITGGGSGIGRATAWRFADQGADVLIIGRNGEGLATTAAGRPRIRHLIADLTTADAPARVVHHALHLFGGIDVLVNNAGISRPARLDAIERGPAEEQIATNLVAPLFLAQQAAAHMEAGGVIVNVTSNPPNRAWPSHSVYGATKVALDFLTRTWAIELAARGIRVVSIAPGVTDTPWFLHAGLSSEQLEAKRNYDRIPLGRPARSDEIAWWIVCATRPEAAYVTGAILNIDGGISIR